MLTDFGIRARQAARALATQPRERKDRGLNLLAEALMANEAAILAANRVDVETALRAGLSPALVDRLTLDPARVEGIAADVQGVAALPDPVGETFESAILANGLRVHKRRVPLGVLGVIYESRPNVTIDVTALALKTGNAVILRGGSETVRSNRALVEVVHQALGSAGLPVDAVQFIDDPDRARVTELLHLDAYVDLIIPRGGNALHEFCRHNSSIPVITGGIGICHLFVDETADIQAACRVIHNAKTQRPTVCNALDTVLVHRARAAEFLPALVHMLSADGVSFRADPSVLPYLATIPGPQDDAAVDHHPPLPESVRLAGPQDFDTEWLSLVLGLKVVDSVAEAMEHIRLHSTGHSDGILTADKENARRFVEEIDSAAVYVNASTRFTDGSQLGLGAEVAISTQRLHARGPMGLRELTTYKWVIVGDYHVRG
ncbi:MAG: glutamate-5-semialdehyde dehydrogenase [Anaerolineales bacterium]|nr:glutamate-5-semialdehyde dehydrogenase [Anaerolineales bacterium]